MSTVATTSRRVTEVFAEHVDAAIQRHGEGEEIFYEVQIAPNDQSGVSLVLVVWLPSGVVGEWIVGSIAFHEAPPSITAGRVDENINRFLAGMRAERSKAIGAATGTPYSAPQAQSGLILP